MSRTRNITDAESWPIVCPVTELSLYSGTRLAAFVRHLKTQLSRGDPSEEFKVGISRSSVLFDFLFEAANRILKYCLMTATPDCYCLQCFDAVGWAAGRASGL